MQSSDYKAMLRESLKSDLFDRLNLDKLEFLY